MTTIEQAAKLLQQVAVIERHERKKLAAEDKRHAEKRGDIQDKARIQKQDAFLSYPEEVRDLIKREAVEQ
jgi:hypothetical protein